MFTPNSTKNFQHEYDELNKAKPLATPEASLEAPTEADTGVNQSVFDMPPPTSKDASARAKDSGILHEAEVLDNGVYPAVRKRKRNCVRGNYLAADLAQFLVSYHGRGTPLALFVTGWLRAVRASG